MKNFIFLKGCHYPYIIFLFMPILWMNEILLSFKKRKTITWKVNFPKNADYSKGEGNDHINKLLGVMLGLVKKNGSYRIGWKPMFGIRLIELFQYRYDENGKIMSKHLVDINYEKDYTFRFELTKIRAHRLTTVTVFLNDTQIDMYTIRSKSFFGFYHHPYHGGKSTAPHKYSILCKRQENLLIKVIAGLNILSIIGAVIVQNYNTTISAVLFGFNAGSILAGFIIGIVNTLKKKKG